LKGDSKTIIDRINVNRKKKLDIVAVKNKKLIQGLTYLHDDIKDVYFEKTDFINVFFAIEVFKYSLYDEKFKEIILNMDLNEEELLPVYEYLYCKENPIKDETKLNHYKKIAQCLLKIRDNKSIKSVVLNFDIEYLKPLVDKYYKECIAKKLEGTVSTNKLNNVANVWDKINQVDKVFSVKINTDSIHVFSKEWFYCTEKWIRSIKHLLFDLDGLINITYRNKDILDM
jgi:hypothetical protein